MKILIPVDGSAYTKRMLAYLVTHDEWLGGTNSFTALHAAPAVPPRAAAVVDKDTLKDYYLGETEKVFKPIRSFFAKKPALSVDFVSKIGHAADAISQTATKGKYDLIIMGSHGMGSFTNLVMGSVATKVLAQCAVPVLLIR
jgi:nucleotide-binding universal stress UspA family protein